MKTLIVDDEPLARSRLRRLLKEHPSFECVGEASNTEEALTLVEELTPDLVMLDIEMPGGDGLSLAKVLNQRQIPPAIILVTAHPEHALDAYNVGPSDYLLKPLDPKRLKDALERLGTHTLAHIEKNEEQNPWISFHVGNSHRRIRFEEVQYFMAEDKVVKMVFDGGEAIVDLSLKEIESTYRSLILRVHRKTLINKSRLIGIKLLANGYHYITLYRSDEELEVSRRLTSSIKHLVQNFRPSGN